MNLKSLSVAIFILLNFEGFAQKEKGGLLGGILKTVGTALNTKVVTGEWTDLGAGGQSFEAENSPRNHYYKFDISSANTEIEFKIETDLWTSAEITSDLGKKMGNFSNFSTYKKVKFERPGTYYMRVSAKRYGIGKYRIDITGAISNWVREEPNNHITLENITFREEGGSYTDYSSRNLEFTFEPKLDTYFDINIESRGTLIEGSIIDPMGKKYSLRGDHSEGIRYRVEQATKKGLYSLWIKPQNHDGRGILKIDVFGTFNQPLTEVKHTFSEIREQFSDDKKNVAVYEINIGSEKTIEILYRSSKIGATIRMYDEYNKQVYSFYTSSKEQFYNKAENFKEGKYKLLLITEPKEKGEYELLIWGLSSPLGAPLKKTLELKEENPLEGLIEGTISPSFFKN